MPWDAVQIRLARRKTGEEFLRYFVELGALRPNDAVLDVGCGRGRMAISLTRYLRDGGRYEGFDVIASSVAWCSQYISRRYPHFQFTFPDIYNAEYNPTGKHRASEYVFPYADASFDLVFLTSVFTHMLPGELEHYLSEIGRVTKKGGRCMATFFLLNEESLRLIGERRSSQDFRAGEGVWLTTDAQKPEAAVAYEENYVRDLFPPRSFTLNGLARYGSWCGRSKYLSYQDVLVATKV